MERKRISQIVFILEILLLIVTVIIIYRESVYRLKYGWPKPKPPVVWHNVTMPAPNFTVSGPS